MVNSQSNHYFNFEDDFIKDLRCIPLCVRRKLDLIGIKLKITHWQDFNLIEKNKIVDWPDSKNDLIDLKTFLKEITSNSKYGEAKEIEISINQPWQNKNKYNLLYNIKSAYNRLVIFKANIYHGMAYDNDKFKNNFRKNQIIFIK